MAVFKDFKWRKPEEEADEIRIRNVRERGTFSASRPNAIINIVRDEAAAGKKYGDGDVSSDILANGRVWFIEVPLALWPLSGNGDPVLRRVTPAISLPAAGVAGSARTISLGNRMRCQHPGEISHC